MKRKEKDKKEAQKFELKYKKIKFFGKFPCLLRPL